MRFLFISTTFFIFFGSAFAGDFQLQYIPLSANEIKIDALYTGEAAEITLPARGRILSVQNQENLNFGNGQIRIGIKVGDEEAIDKEYSVRFSYSLILSGAGTAGYLTGNWFPKIKKQPNLNYHFSLAEGVSNILIFPYRTNDTLSYYFMQSDNPKLLNMKYTLEKFQGTVPVTLYKGMNFNTTPADIDKIYQYFQAIFGDNHINEIVVINSSLLGTDSSIVNDKLYITIPGRGTFKQIQQIMANAWSHIKENLSLRLFNMFKDAVIRLSKIDLEAQSGENQEKPGIRTYLQNDPAYVVAVAPAEYYQDLVRKGFENNSVLDVDAAGIINNYGLLHLAWFNMGPETFLAGVKNYFTQEVKSNANESMQTETNSNNFDADLVDWSIIMQNKVSEPLFSLYTKEVLREKGLVPVLEAHGKTISRNSEYIPDIEISQNNGSTQFINWNNKKTAELNFEQGSYQLDPEYIVPRKKYINSFYSFDTNEQIQRRLVLALATRIKGPGEQNLRDNLEVIKITAEENNTFDIEPGTTVYIVVSHVLSNINGNLKDAIKESVIAIINGSPMHIATRIRI